VRPASYLAILALLASAPAGVRAAEARPVFVAGYDTGGDDILKVTFGSGTADSIGANEGLYLGGGVSLLNGARNVEFLGTLSYKYQAIHASNGDITWTRFPLDALLFYRWQSFRAGGGATYVLRPRLKGSGDASNIYTAFGAALGAVLQADYLVGGVAFGLRYTILEYQEGGTTVKSNGVGATFGFTF
jgi:hypothetical protein